MEETDIFIGFINITNSEEEFSDILEEFPLLLEKEISNLIEIEVEDIFPTSISLKLKGQKFDIIEAINHLPELLISLDIFTFGFNVRIIEEN